VEHEVREIKLAGGAKLLVINLPVAVSFAFNIYVRSGFRFARLNQYELPHLLEHLSFEGNALYPDALAFKTEVEKDGTYFNAFTNTDYNNYQFVSLPGELNRIIDLGLAQIFQPILKPKSIAHEQETVINELQGFAENYSQLRFYTAYQVLFGRNVPDWSKRITNIKSVTLADLQQFHQAHYRPQNIRFTLSGKFSESDITAATDRMNQALSRYPSGPANQYQPYNLEPFERQVITKRIPLKNQVLFALEFVRPGLNMQDIPSLHVLQGLYSGGWSSRMMIKSRQQGLTYSLQSADGTDDDYTYFEIWDQTEPAKLLPLLRLAVEELVALAQGNYTDAELERAIGYKAGIMRRGYQTPASYAEWYGSDYIFDAPLFSPETRIKELLAIDRTAITKAAKRYITKDNWALVILGQKLEGIAEQFTQLIDQAFMK